MKPRKPKPCWYFTTVWYCTICCGYEKIRERRYGKKPNYPKK